jgi:hypothetical protein
MIVKKPQSRVPSYEALSDTVTGPDGGPGVVPDGLNNLLLQIPELYIQDLMNPPEGIFGRPDLEFLALFFR